MLTRRIFSFVAFCVRVCVQMLAAGISDSVVAHIIYHFILMLFVSFNFVCFVGFSSSFHFALVIETFCLDLCMRCSNSNNKKLHDPLPFLCRFVLVFFSSVRCMMPTILRYNDFVQNAVAMERFALLTICCV